MRACAIGLLCAVLGALLRQNQNVFVPLLGIAAVGAVLILGVRASQELTGFIRELAEDSGMSASVPGIVLKTAAISLAATITAQVCRDAGQGAAAAGVELAGYVGALYTALPLMRSAADLIRELL